MGELLTWLLIAAALSLLAGGLVWRRAAARRAGAEREAKRRAEEAAEAQRLAVGRAERERTAAAEREARAAFEREEAARVDAQRRTALRAEAERLAAEQAERERQAAARAEAESAAAKSAAIAEAQRQAVLRAEVERRLAEQAEQAERLAADRAAQAERERVAAAQSAALVTLATKSPAQTLVMVADDSKVVRIKTGRLLAAHQYQVCYASDGLEAQQLMRTHKPDVVITDVEMPGMDGFELTCHIRSQAATAQVPVVMITAADERHREQAAQAGVTVLLGKPYPEEVLLAHIRLAMGQDAAPRQPADSNAHGRLGALA